MNTKRMPASTYKLHIAVIIFALVASARNRFHTYMIAKWLHNVKCLYTRTLSEHNMNIIRTKREIKEFI